MEFRDENILQTWLVALKESVQLKREAKHSTHNLQLMRRMTQSYCDRIMMENMMTQFQHKCLEGDRCPGPIAMWSTVFYVKLLCWGGGGSERHRERWSVFSPKKRHDPTESERYLNGNRIPKERMINANRCQSGSSEKRVHKIHGFESAPNSRPLCSIHVW